MVQLTQITTFGSSLPSKGNIIVDISDWELENKSLFGEIKNNIGKVTMMGFSMKKYWGILSPPPDVKILHIFYSLEEGGKNLPNHCSIHLILSIVDLFALWKNHSLNITTFSRVKALPWDTGTIY